MKPTGLINPITGNEILQCEESDIHFWNKEWNELSYIEKCDFLSLKSIPFLNKQVEHIVIDMYNTEREKHIL